MQSLLMRGQACILYGAAEFSRDIDLAVFCSTENLARLRAALVELDARVVAVPPFELPYLERGHFVHFECGRDDVRGMRVDVAARMRGVAAFDRLWERRVVWEVPEAGTLDVMPLRDLVVSKKTQRDQDWPMIRRLLEADYFRYRERPRSDSVEFWLRELRTPELLVECARAFPGDVARIEVDRPLLRAASRGDLAKVAHGLTDEQERERELDRAYWAPLRHELEALRQAARRSGA